ncbi:hypothetical protein P175DRAFT_0452744 [Aspergillus ochraceoroseus IBT 24754]|uniref:RNA polymerase I-specific transcription initiation factor RRN6-like protein n=2 Tax=Aspergillus ochraceoroseus TaxID=138278 RepID=A0A2T5M1H7_9EURO|nr:uncharacterized protein P175DRAFT_0452744 [Aspergillus ochraceoroseus IBT 24754]KKK24937.1 hypothetical protein AOCH_003071 [Aspergillus ochraceoroseus]PTU22385.1 hypothetical protein P175DRAFT_0452744 [Aspergillus ochraceoroseus IBT 24754]
MDENSTRHLQYGHLGKAIYRPDTQTWSFSRTLTPAPRIPYTGVTKTAVPSPITLSNASWAAAKPPASDGYTKLIKNFPFAQNESLSHIIATTSELCDPLISSLLDFGYAVDWELDTSGRRAVPVVAFASGECGNNITFRTITGDTVELRQEEVHRIRVPTIEKGEAIEWLTGGAPIQQICFSRAPEERGTFMAARSRRSTTIFRPLYSRSPSSVSVGPENGTTTLSNYRSSRLNPNALVELFPSHTGDSPHADVAFNPWNQKQFAIIDEQGNWSIWALFNRHRRNRDNWIAECKGSGSLPWVGVDDVHEMGASGRHDGWMAIEWVCDESHVVVCDRRCSMLYRIEGDRVYSTSIDLGFTRRSEWILDIRRSTSNTSQIFILTTYRIFWLDVAPDSIPVEGNSRPSLHPRLSWRHFRDSDDTTMQLTSFAMDEDFYLVLYSRLNKLVLVFHCPNASEGLDSAPVPDPVILDLPSPLNPTAESDPSSPTLAHFSTLVLKEIAHSPSGLGRNYHDPNMRLLKLFIVDSRLTIHESIYFGPSGGDSAGKRSRGDVLRVKRQRLAGQRKVTAHSWGDFVVDDWDESVFVTDTVPDSGLYSVAPLADPQWTLDYTQIYAIATGSIHLTAQNGRGGLESSFQSSIKELKDKVSVATPIDRLTSPTALEILRRTPIIDDIDQNAHVLEDFISQYASAARSAEGNQNHFLVQLFDPFRSLFSQHSRSAESPRLSLVDIYDRLVNSWLVSLPRDTPGRARIAKEKAIRGFVADLVLGQIISVHSPNEAESNELEQKDQSISSTKGFITPSSTGDEYSSLVPLPTPSIYESHTQSSSITATQNRSTFGVDISPGIRTETRPTFSALSSYTTFTNQRTMSRDVEHILDHWKPGNNPATYTLLSESARQLKSTSSKRKLRKKQSQSQSQSQSQLQLHSIGLDSSIPFPPSSPPPIAREWGSQPDNSQPPMIRLQSSQVTDDLPMTQIERGAFGGREATRKSGIKARKKKRAAGF